MGHRHLISTEVMADRCQRCGAGILTAVAEGLWAHVDPFPLDRRAETVALILGWWCYSLTGKTLIRRDGSLRSGPILVEHHCGSPRLGSLITPSRAQPESSTPPF